MPALRDVVPTRSVLLELKDERAFTREGHELLDQKRMLLAAEILKWLARYERLLERLLEAQSAARKALAEAVSLHGVAELCVHPAGQLDLHGFYVETERFLGITIAANESVRQPPAGPLAGQRPQTSPSMSFVEAAERAVNPSPEARRCRERHAELVVLAVDAALAYGNIARLLAEYRRTERRANALENVVLPELSLTVEVVEERLEEQEQEEAARFRSRSTRASQKERVHERD